MTDSHLDAELLVQVFSQVLSRIDGAVLTASTAKTEHQAGEATLNVTAHMGIGQLIDAVEEGQNLAVVLEEANDRLVKSCQLLVRLIASWIMGGATVKDVTTAVAALVFRYALTVREAEHLDNQRPLGIVLREGGWSVLRVRFIGISLGGLIAVGTTGRHVQLTELRQLGELTEQHDKIGIREITVVEQLAQVLHGGRNRLNEVAFPFEVASETVSAQHL